jgi:anti-sigma regulatory factor (Ser/Thr protein kinase)
MEQARREWRIGRGDLKGAAAARRDFSRYLRAKPGGEDEHYDAALIFGELVSNAVKCARTSVSVELTENGWTELRVTDDGDCFDTLNIRPQPLEAQSGRGLYIVNLLARRLDITRGDRCCEVRAVLPIHS